MYERKQVFKGRHKVVGGFPAYWFAMLHATDKNPFSNLPNMMECCKTFSLIHLQHMQFVLIHNKWMKYILILCHSFLFLFIEVGKNLQKNTFSVTCRSSYFAQKQPKYRKCQWFKMIEIESVIKWLVIKISTKWQMADKHQKSTLIT